MIPWNHVPNSEISRLMEIHTFVDNNNNNKTIKRTQKYSFEKKKKRITPVASQLMEFCPLREKSDVWWSTQGDELVSNNETKTDLIEDDPVSSLERLQKRSISPSKGPSLSSLHWQVRSKQVGHILQTQNSLFFKNFRSKCRQKQASN